MIVGLCGYAQSGKDTLAQLMVREMEFERRAFADLMKQMLLLMNPYVRFTNDFGMSQFMKLKDLIDAIGWEEAKQYSEVRVLLQRLGTEAGREILGEDVWIRPVLDKPFVKNLVVSDVRFQNEADAIKARGGTIFRIIREGRGPANGHISESAYRDQDFIIYNDGEPHKMLEQLKRNFP